MGLFSGFVSRSSGYHPASILEHEFDFSGSIGQGQYGTVWRCSSRATKQEFACKQIKKSQFPSHDQMRQVSREIEAMQKLQGHANVVDLHSVYENESFIFLLMELCPEGDLFTQISANHGLPETDARYVFKRVALAVQHCRRNGIVHRDIKPENILLRDPALPSSITHQAQTPNKPILPLSRVSDADSSAALACGCAPSRGWEVKLADFGLSRRLDEGSRLRGCVGSFPYEAPEVVASEPYDWSADVWSLGVLLYTMLAASWPEFKDGRRELNEDADWSSQCWRLVSDAAKDLIRRMMSMNPCERPTIDEVLCDAWLSYESCVNVLCPVACEALLERIAQNERDDGKDVAQQCLLKAVAVRSSPSLSTWLSAGLMSAPSLSSSLSSSSASSGKRVPFSESISSDSNSSHSSDGSISESSGVIDSRRGGAYGVAQCCAEAAKWEEVVQKSSSSSSYDEVEVELNPLAQQEAVRRRECCAQGESGCRDCSSDHDDGSGIGSSSSSSGGGSGSGFEWWQKSRLAAVAAWAVKNVWGPPAAAC